MSAKNDSGNLDSGANVIGEGTFGCAHKPSMMCRDKTHRNANEISKLMTSVNAIKELDTENKSILARLEALENPV